MNTRWHLQLVHDLHMKSVILFWRIAVRAIGLLDSDDGYFFAQDFERNLFHEEPHALRSTDRCIPN